MNLKTNRQTGFDESARPTETTGFGTRPTLGDILAELCKQTSIELQFQALSRGGSDASCSAAKGLCPHPITLGLPMENSHGYEIIHKVSIGALADLTVALLKQLAG